MILTVGDERVVFSPKALKIVNAAGRVDVHGDRGTATLVRRSEGEDQWQYVTRSPKRAVPLTEETFLELLRSVMR